MKTPLLTLDVTESVIMACWIGKNSHFSGRASPSLAANNITKPPSKNYVLDKNLRPGKNMNPQKQQEVEIQMSSANSPMLLLFSR